jgi:hypothetical protein
LAVLIGMMGIEQRDDQRGGDAYFVPRPRATDALGESLRCAFNGGRRLPDDLSKALDALDRITWSH